MKKLINFTNNYIFCLKLILKANKLNFIIIIILNILTNITPFINLYVMKNIINNINSILSNNLITASAWYILLTNFILYFSLSIIVGFLCDFGYKLSTLQLQDLLSYINISLMRKSVDIDISYFDLPNKFDDMSRSRENSHALHQMVFSTIETLSNILFLISAIILTFKINLIISISVFISIIPNFLFKKNIEKRKYEFDKKIYRDNRKSNYLYSLLFDRNTAKEFRFFSIGNTFLQSYLELNKEIITKKNRFSQKNALLDILLNLPSVILQIMIQIYIIIKIAIHLYTLGDFIYITGIYNNMKTSIQNLSGNISMYIGYNKQIEDFKKYFMYSECNVISGSKIIKRIDSIEFRNVYFKYPLTDNMVLNDISFKIRRGEKIALIGTNGSGKTTIIKLLTRFYEPTSGEIYFNGINVKEINIEALRLLVSSVFQDYNVYSFTIRENVAISSLDKIYENKLIIDALNLSEFHNKVFEINKNIDTYIGKNFNQNGIDLSGGENQKIAISRAVFRKSDIVLLDEPTASLDPEAEHKILQYFKKLYNDKTLLMISHRLSNTVMMDRIIVIDNGRLIENGTHKELIANNSQYAFLFKLQADKYKAI